MNRYLVAQIGARRGYSVASALERAGMLEALYTDLCADLNPGRAACHLGGALQAGAIRRLADRRIPNSVLSKTHSFAWPALRYELQKRLASGNPRRQLEALSGFADQLGRAMARRGFGAATHLYTMLGDVTPLLEASRASGLSTVTEIYVIPTGERIIAGERERYPGFEPPPPSGFLDSALAWLRRVVFLSDWFVAPSEAVRDDLARSFGVSMERCLVIPYAAGDGCFSVCNRPERGQVLFVGTAGIRKGIHTLGQTARVLGGERYHYRVAGDADEAVRTHQLTRSLTFLGRLSRRDLTREYEVADVFVLPSLVEGSAEAIYEALAAGIPVVTTHEAGSIVQDGVEGFIVPASAPEILASRLRQIIEDRELRSRMAHGARQRAREFTFTEYSSRLAAGLASLPRKQAASA